MSTNIELPTDSFEYEILKDAAKRIKDIPGMTCEIGVRRGGGSKVIIDSLIENNDLHRQHICIDPYGNIEYYAGDHILHLDYHNQMRNDCLKNIWAYVQNLPINLNFFVLEDTEFFKRYGDGVPVYNNHKTIMNEYALVHFDGPHTNQAVHTEIEFFLSRTNAGSMFVFDDILDYDHDEIENFLFANNFQLIQKGQKKASYIKIRGVAQSG